MMVIFRIAALAAAAALAGCNNAHTTPAAALLSPAEQMASAAITIKADVDWLADDAREGREAGSSGYDAAAKYVADRMRAIGVKPGAGGSYYQQVPLIAGAPVLDAATLTLIAADGAETPLTSLEDFRVYPSLASDDFTIASAPLVFVGFGVHAPQFGHDDFADIDLDGKVAVYFQGAPDTFDSEQRAHFGSGGVKAQAIASRGGIGAISLYTTAAKDSSPWDRVVANPSSQSMTWMHEDGSPDVSGPGIRGSAVLHPDRAHLLFAGAPKTFDAVLAEADAEGAAPAPFDLNVKISMSGALMRESITSPNVVGVIRGSDRALRNEYILLSAHLDHTGLNQALIDEGKDGLNNGAMDNALGVSIMLDVAERLVAAKPRRSIIVAAVTAEEKGLLGADYFAHYPVVPLRAISANLNLDMPVMLHDFTDVVAFGGERTTIGDIMKRILDAQGVALSPDPFPELGVFTRSDHYRFVEKGVPSAFLFPGFANGGEAAFGDFMANHYHRPSDEPSLPIRYDSVARFAWINFLIAEGLANADERASWKENDFFGDLFAGD